MSTTDDFSTYRRRLICHACVHYGPSFEEGLICCPKDFTDCKLKVCESCGKLDTKWCSLCMAHTPNSTGPKWRKHFLDEEKAIEYAKEMVKVHPTFHTPVHYVVVLDPGFGEENQDEYYAMFSDAVEDDECVIFSTSMVETVEVLKEINNLLENPRKSEFGNLGQRKIEI